MTAVTAATADVATMALEAVMRGDLDEARELVGQLDEDDRLEILGCYGTLYGITLHVGEREPLP